MSEISTVGLDLAKNVFQIHGIDATVREKKTVRIAWALLVRNESYRAEAA